MTIKNKYTGNQRVEILAEDVKYIYKFLGMEDEYKGRIAFNGLTNIIKSYCDEINISYELFYSILMRGKFPYTLTVNTHNIDVPSIQDSITKDYDSISEMLHKGTLCGERHPLSSHTDEYGRVGLDRYVSIDPNYVDFIIHGLLFKNNTKFSAVISLLGNSNSEFIENIRKYYDDGILRLRALYSTADRGFLKCEKFLTLDTHSIRINELITKDSPEVSSKNSDDHLEPSHAIVHNPCNISPDDENIDWSKLISTNLEDNWDDNIIVNTEIREILEIKVKYHNSSKSIEIRQNGDWIDLCVNENKFMIEGNHYMLPLGVSIKLPDGYEAHLLPRSSTMKKTGLILANSMGIIDNSYCGDKDEWKASVYATKTTHVLRGDRLFQFRIVKSMNKDIKITEVDSLGDSNRGGFGSTGN